MVYVIPDGAGICSFARRRFTLQCFQPRKDPSRTLRLDIMNNYQSKDQAVRIQYSNKTPASPMPGKNGRARQTGSSA
jgi:hypothetical protein